MAQKLTVLVTGATGHQGGAVSRMLLKKGHTVRVFTRKPDSKEALELQRLGAVIYNGDMEDGPSLERAARGCDCLYAMSTPMEHGAKIEAQQGMNEADVCKKLGIRHLVYSSVAGANQKTGIPFFDSKLKVERHIQDIGVPYTIVAPAFFCENLLSPDSMSQLKKGHLTLPQAPGRKLQMVSLADLGAFDVYVMEHRDRFLSERVDIASFELTGVQMAESLTKVLGRRIDFVEQPIASVRAYSADLGKMYEWLNTTNYRIDVTGLHRDYPEVAWTPSFEQWARLQDFSQLRATLEAGRA